MTSLDTISEALDSYGSKGKRSNGGYMYQCPSHSDSNASLSVTYAPSKQATLVHCFSGCDARDVVTALGLELGDLFDEKKVSEKPYVVASYPYYTRDGKIKFYKDRYSMEGGRGKSFRLRLPGTDPGDTHGLNGERPVALYRAPEVQAAMARGERIRLVEGERDVAAWEARGFVATTTIGGASAEWSQHYTDFLAAATGGVDIVADQDPCGLDGKLGPGHQWALRARAGLRGAGVKVRVLRPASGKDSRDHFDAGLKPDQFVTDTAVFLRPRGMRGDVLRSTELPQPRWVIPGFLPEGMAILAGSPKAGKSWAALDIAMAVACGGLAMGALRCNPASVLYLAREDSAARIQSRMALLDPSMTQGCKSLEVVSGDVPWPSGPESLAALTEWAEEVEDPGLVVLDTWGRVEPSSDTRGSAYAQDYGKAAAYQQWGLRHHCSVLLIHHDRKDTDGTRDDPFKRISGTQGLTGAADVMMFLAAKRGEKTGTLYATGRDIGDEELEMRKVGPVWQMLDVPEGARSLRSVR